MERVIKKINKTKRESRSGGWSFNRYADTFNLFEKIIDNCERHDSKNLSHSQFIKLYEKPNKPVILTNITDTWLAHKKWTPERLMKKYRNQKFKCGEDDEGYNVKIKMKYYIPYCTHLCHLDDSPLYIFDGSFGEQGKKVSLLQDYVLPEYFHEDLFKYTSERRRPPYRWIVIGPSRSGTGIHIDPLGTSAWNALVNGHKRWCLFPPDTPKELIKVKTNENKKSKGEAITWFNVVYPRTKTPEWPSQYKPFGGHSLMQGLVGTITKTKIECVQGPGETIFVPSGWWHVVMNLDFTVAVTQNYVSTTNFPIVWVKTVRSRPRLARKWYKTLKAYRPDLAKMADDIDRRPDKGLSLLHIKDTSYSSSSSTSSSSSSEDLTSRSSSLSSTMSDGHTLNTGFIKDGNKRWHKFKGLQEQQQQQQATTNGQNNGHHHSHTQQPPTHNGYTNGSVFTNNNDAAHASLDSFSNIERVRKRRRKLSTLNGLNGGTSPRYTVGAGLSSRSNSSCSSSLGSFCSSCKNSDCRCCIKNGSKTGNNNHHHHHPSTPYSSDSSSLPDVSPQQGRTKSSSSNVVSNSKKPAKESRKKKYMSKNTCRHCLKQMEEENEVSHNHITNGALTSTDLSHKPPIK